jgi:hypothetical protein
VYDRNYDGKTLSFEPSGGLMNASLVMQDKETDTYWSIMTGTALAGSFKGTELVELPIGVKAQWKDWVADHPDTRVLSVDGTEHVSNNPLYDNYFKSDEVFRDGKVKDTRLGPKEAIYSFQLDGKAYAVPFEAFENGGTFDLGGRTVFLYRPSGVEIFYSTLAFVASDSSFENEGGVWRHSESGGIFDPDAGAFGEVERLDGFDTFWFNWSMTHPETEVLTR